VGLKPDSDISHVLNKGQTTPKPKARLTRLGYAAVPPAMRLILIVVLLVLTGTQARAAGVITHDRYFVASDGARLHYIEAGPPSANASIAHTIVLVPGWTMPAWIFQAQIQALARRYHVVAFDPRGQGASDVPSTGYEPIRRGADIGDLLNQLGPGPVLILGWSLGVLDTLAYVHTHGDARIAGLILVDNSVGEDPPPPVLPRPPGPPPPKPPHAEGMRRFVEGMFRTHPAQAWLDHLTQATLRTPETAARALLAYPFPRSYWREAVYATTRPVLYIVRPRWAAQADTLVRNRPGTESEIFTNAGHALFVDEPARFNAIVESFIRRRVWP
jgi:non-heme chloroperoxidase